MAAPWGSKSDLECCDYRNISRPRQRRLRSITARYARHAARALGAEAFTIRSERLRHQQVHARPHVNEKGRTVQSAIKKREFPNAIKLLQSWQMIKEMKIF
jgi:hypothetical protein